MFVFQGQLNMKGDSRGKILQDRANAMQLILFFSFLLNENSKTVMTI